MRVTTCALTMLALAACSQAPPGEAFPAETTTAPAIEESPPATGWVRGSSTDPITDAVTDAAFVRSIDQRASLHAICGEDSLAFVIMDDRLFPGDDGFILEYRFDKDAATENQPAPGVAGALAIPGAYLFKADASAADLLTVRISSDAMSQPVVAQFNISGANAVLSSFPACPDVDRNPLSKEERTTAIKCSIVRLVEGTGAAGLGRCANLEDAAQTWLARHDPAAEVVEKCHSAKAADGMQTYAARRQCAERLVR